MVIFKTDAGPGGKMGKGTKPNGKTRATQTKPGSKGVKSSQPASGSKPSGKYGGGMPMGKKPAGKHGSAPAPKRQATPISKDPSTCYKDRSGHPAPVPGGQGMGKNTIPNGQNNTPRTKVGW